MILWFVLAIVEPAYISYCVYVFYTGDAYDAYTDITGPFVILGIIALVRTVPPGARRPDPYSSCAVFSSQIVRVAAIIVAVKVYLNFGKGLRHRVFDRIDAKSGSTQDDDSGVPTLEINM